jgi:predicted Holliday junction resolvase-like endonuclease
MTRTPSLLLLGLAAIALQGCIAKTALDIATAPIKVGSKAVDLATTSQSEADEKRGRELRRREEKLGKLERRYRDQREDCEDGSRKACEKARETYQEIERLRPTIPYAPDD